MLRRILFYLSRLPLSAFYILLEKHNVEVSNPGTARCQCQINEATQMVNRFSFAAARCYWSLVAHMVITITTPLTFIGHGLMIDGFICMYVCSITHLNNSFRLLNILIPLNSVGIGLHLSIINILIHLCLASLRTQPTKAKCFHIVNFDLLYSI